MPTLREYTSASLITLGKASWRYGRVEVRAKLPSGRGMWPAIWMLGVNRRKKVRWPECGEIDIFQWIGSDDDSHFTTYQWGSSAFPVDHGDANEVPFTTGPEQWHVYGVRFNDDTISFTFDGEVTATKRYDDPDDHTHRIILNMAIGGDQGAPIAEDFEREILQVDWVRVTDASGELLWSDEMNDEDTTKTKWFPHIGFAYNNEEQYYTDWDADNFEWHDDPSFGECAEE